MVLEDLQATARLAHLDLSEDETAAALPAFERMLGYFAAMRAADEDRDVFGVSVSELSLSRSSVAGNRLRDDINNSNNTGNNLFNNQADNPADALLAAAPEREGRFLVVPNVL
jgi:aspartyl-tRNA(Asn)/glutamyl-tRNA(Gln) amidotransferase subunit C